MKYKVLINEKDKTSSICENSINISGGFYNYKLEFGLPKLSFFCFEYIKKYQNIKVLIDEEEIYNGKIIDCQEQKNDKWKIKVIHELQVLSSIPVSCSLLFEKFRLYTYKNKCQYMKPIEFFEDIFSCIGKSLYLNLDPEKKYIGWQDKGGSSIKNMTEVFIDINFLLNYNQEKIQNRINQEYFCMEETSLFDVLDGYLRTCGLVIEWDNKEKRYTLNDGMDILDDTNFSASIPKKEIIGTSRITEKEHFLFAVQGFFEGEDVDICYSPSSSPPTVLTHWMDYVYSIHPQRENLIAFPIGYYYTHPNGWIGYSQMYDALVAKKLYAKGKILKTINTHVKKNNKLCEYGNKYKITSVSDAEYLSVEKFYNPEDPIFGRRRGLKFSEAIIPETLIIKQPADIESKACTVLVKGLIRHRVLLENFGDNQTFGVRRQHLENGVWVDAIQGYSVQIFLVSTRGLYIYSQDGRVLRNGDISSLMFDF